MFGVGQNYSVKATVSDGAGNTSTPAEQTITIDASAPTILNAKIVLERY